MLNKEKLLKNLEKDINNLENRINHRILYNFRNAIITFFIKSGIIIDKVLPFILSSIILFYGNKTKGKTPFICDKIKENATLITTVTSNNDDIKPKIEYTSYPYNKSIEYSTKWELNDNGFYERTITQYELNSFVNTLTIDEILEMTKDEIEKMFYILDIKTIQKKQLDKEDQIYKENLVIVNVYDTDTNHYRYRNETFKENAISTLMYLILSLLLGFSLKKVDKIIFKDYFIDRFNLLLINYKNIEKTEIDELRKIIKLKKENLLLLKEDNNDFISPSKVLIKQRRHK